MSISFHISCRDCRETLWIGQSGGDNGWVFYTGHPEIIDSFEKFCFEHQGHELFFSDNSAWSNDPNADSIGNYEDYKPSDIP